MPANPTPTPTPGSTLLLTQLEAAAQLRISDRQVYHYTKIGLLRCVRLGRNVRWTMADLQDFISRMQAEQAVEVHVEGCVEAVTP